MKVLSLFSGGGLGDYGLYLAGMEIAGQVEIDEYCQKILALRFPESKKWRDIKNVKGEEVLKQCGKIDIISGGFPCQPFSLAGKRKGKSDERYLWPEMLRIISEVKPAYVFGENVVGIVNSALDTVLSDLEGIGYTCQSFIVPACAFDAPHKRQRVWIVGYAEHFRYTPAEIAGKQARQSAGSSKQHGALANAKGNGMEGRTAEPQEQSQGKTLRRTIGGGKALADTASEQSSSANHRREQGTVSEPREIESGRRRSSGGLREGYWPSEPAVGRVANGIANRVDRLKLLGNGQVVQAVRWFGEIISNFHNGFY